MKVKQSTFFNVLCIFASLNVVDAILSCTKSIKSIVHCSSSPDSNRHKDQDFGLRNHPSRCNWKNSTIGRPGATPPSNVVSSPCRCDRYANKCYSVIQWEQTSRKEMLPVLRYRIKFLKDIQDPNDYLDCFTLPNKTRSFNFTFDAGSVGYEGTIPFVLGAEPIQLMVSMPYYWVKCNPDTNFERYSLHQSTPKSISKHPYISAGIFLFVVVVLVTLFLRYRVGSIVPNVHNAAGASIRCIRKKAKVTGINTEDNNEARTLNRERTDKEGDFHRSQAFLER